MKKIYNPTIENWSEILKRPTPTFNDIEETVKGIFKEVQTKGDSAVAKYTSLFDGIKLENIEVSEAEIEKATTLISEELKQAIQVAKSNIEKFHAAQKTSKIEIETTEGVLCWQEKRPIQKIGLYIPGGSAPLFSTVLMLAVPAQLAGCNEIVLCSPPDKNGNINPAILYTANLCGVTKIRKVGGIQAIAAMTFGTEIIPKVYKIFGPGNQFVTVAKQVATQFGVAIDMPAGPSELLVVADDSANPSFVASDLLSQAEHGSDSQVILVSTSKTFIDKVEQEIESQLKLLPRKEIAQKAIDHSKLIYVENDAIALDLINEYGSEHLIICVENEDFYVNGIVNAGSVFIGNFTPESAGDYASGTNHTLPTNGYAKNYSGVNLDSFLKAMTFQKISEKGIQNIGRAIEIMAEAEGLQAHKNAVSLRLKQYKMTNFNIQNITRENIKIMKSYSSARDEFKDFSHNMVYLDANENPFSNGINRYPDPQQKKLKDVLSKQKKINENQILLGNGSDEVLDLLFRAFCEPNKDNIITLPPTYGMYGVLANLNAIDNREVVLSNDFQPNVDEIIKKTDLNTKIIFLCSPNNPTGNSFDDEAVLKLLKNFNGLIVIDEAYIDFSKNKSWIDEMNNYPNLVVTQTLSKAYAMAGLRIGILYASTEIVSVLNKIKPPYNINNLSQETAEKKLEQNTLQFQIKKIVNERQRLIKNLASITFIEKVFPTDANFILIKVDDAEKRYNQLLDKGIVIRNRSNQALCENCLRITIGTKNENEQLINTLKLL